MQLYDLLYIISNKFTDEEINSIKEQIEIIIQKNNGIIVKTMEVGKRKLSYPIKQDRYGSYFRIFFNLDPIDSKKLNRDLKLSTNIIRYQIIKTKALFMESPLPKMPTEIKISKEEKEEKREKEEKEETPKIQKQKISLDELDKLNEENLDKILSHE
ncbi:MAG: 30S ribosomal protein S6 [Patescibacteria group bacterium]